jgi:hypothetical protein
MATTLDPGGLAALISLLWRDGLKATSGRPSRNRARIAPAETPHPLADALQQFWEDEVFRARGAHIAPGIE